jgi:Rrf2 family protein
VSNLLRVSEAASLGIHTMALLAKADRKHLSNGEIAEVLHGSGNTLAKVLQRLARAGLVDSVRGPGGGFALRKPAHETTLMEIFEAIEGPLDPPRCLLGTPICGAHECVLGCMIQSVNREMARHLAETSLAKLADSVCLPTTATTSSE